MVGHASRMGRVYGGSTVKNSFIIGTTDAEICGVGGLVGMSYGEVRDCRVDKCFISGKGTTVKGVVGAISADVFTSTATDCYIVRLADDRSKIIELPTCDEGYPKNKQTEALNDKRTGIIFKENKPGSSEVKIDIGVWHDTNGFGVPACAVTFDMQGHGAAVPYQLLKTGEKVTKPADPTAAGYTFSGWYKEAACTTQWNFDTDTVSKYTPLFAKWTANTYTVTFDANGGAFSPDSSTTKVIQETYDTKYTLPSESPSLDGGDFEGWFTTQGEMITNESIVKITADQTFYAYWSQYDHLVTFDNMSHGTAPNQQRVKTGGKVTEPDYPTETCMCVSSRCATGWKGNRT